MRGKEYRAILQAASEVLGEAMHIVDARGTTIMYNEAMARLEKISVEDAMGKPFRQVFSNIPESESTLYQALVNRREIREQEQNYLNIYGKQVTTINTTIPIIVDDRVVAAMEIARDITDIKDMSDRILTLQDSISAGAREKAAPESAAESEGGTGAGRTKSGEIRHYHFEDIIGEDPNFLQAVERAMRATSNTASVFIYGETGTGKELFAQSIHYGGKRQNKPFLAQNCAAIPESLLEGILFGTEKGGFTGAVDRAGLFEQANGGTLLLDEVSAMPYELQSKLLRVLQEKYIRRVGGGRDILVDVRIVATVNEPPQALIERGALRPDLYYRLNVIGISIPSLRERRRDIPILADQFIKKYNREYGREIWMIADRALEKLEEHDYPGNVRELENIIMSAVSMAEEEHVLTERDIDIQKSYREGSSAVSEYDRVEGTLAEYLARIEQTVIRQYLTANGGNVTRTARDLGMLRQNLQHKLKKYELG
ncbi:MAG: sigma 54-interacting transcriptional regulator [Bacillota bacterium]|nr:sigma 54-interacting transcriptional regulator [Bacillota bacterium]